MDVPRDAATSAFEPDKVHHDTKDDEMSALHNKVAIVTGASSGIGYATAKLFAQEGAKVVVAARRKRELDLLVGEITRAGGSAVALSGDVKDENYAMALVELAEAHFGGLDVAFNNAGTLGAMRATSEIDISDWEGTLRTNLTSAFLGAKHQIPAMLRRGAGSVVFTSTFVGYTVGLPKMAAYAEVRSNRAHPGARYRIWFAGHPCKRVASRRDRYSDGPGSREHSGGTRLRRWSTRDEAHCVSRRNRQISALSRI